MPQPSALLLLVLAACTGLNAGGYTGLIDVSPGILGHLRASDGGWPRRVHEDTRKPDSSKQHPFVAIDPYNNTVCWVEDDPDRVYDYTLSSEDDFAAGVLHCYRLGDASAVGWTLPMPSWMRSVKALAFDWVAQAWHVTTAVPQEWRMEMRIRSHIRSYVCSYRFDKCLRLSESVSKRHPNDLFAAYDMTNRLLFHNGDNGIESVGLDGRLNTSVYRYDLGRSLKGLAVDPVHKHVYWVTERGPKLGYYRVDYNGGNRRETMIRPTFSSIPVANFPGAVVFRTSHALSVVPVSEDDDTTSAGGLFPRKYVLPLMRHTALALIQTIPDVQEDAESVISGCRDCQDICVPTTGNIRSCFCQEDYEVAQLQCKKKQPGYVVVAGPGSLQAVDLKTEQVSTILTGLTNVTKVDYLWEGGDLYRLFWLDEGSLFSGSWSPGAAVSDVQTIARATDTERLVDVAVDWQQRNIIWLKIHLRYFSANHAMFAEIASLNGSFVKTLFAGQWAGESHSVVVHISGRYSVFSEHDNFRRRVYRERLRGGSLNCYSPAASGADMAGFVADTSVPEEENGGLDRVLWIDRRSQTLGYSFRSTVFSLGYELQPKYTGAGQISLPELGDAGGLDVLDGRVYWSVRSSGQLWTARVDTGGGDARPLAGAGGGPLRVLHPRRQPQAERRVCGEQAGCSHLCVRALAMHNVIDGNLVTTTRQPVSQCACPNGMALGRDGKTCQPTRSPPARWTQNERPWSEGCDADITEHADPVTVTV